MMPVHSIQFCVGYDPYRNARICLVKYEDGEMRYILHAVGYYVGQEVISSRDAPIFVGNAVPLDKVPIGTMVHNIEMHPDFGGAIEPGQQVLLQLFSPVRESISLSRCPAPRYGCCPKIPGAPLERWAALKHN
eukprot:g16620.t1